MDCKNHADVAAADRCTGCAEGFCENCLIEMRGQKYCGQCKYMNVKGPPVVEEALIPCEEAGSALKYALWGIFCFGFILGPIAISKARKAQKLIEVDPQLAGSGKAMAALIIGTIDLIFWVLNFFGKMARFN